MRWQTNQTSSYVKAALLLLNCNWVECPPKKASPKVSSLCGVEQLSTNSTSFLKKRKEGAHTHTHTAQAEAVLLLLCIFNCFIYFPHLLCVKTNNTFICTSQKTIDSFELKNTFMHMSSPFVSIQFWHKNVTTSNEITTNKTSSYVKVGLVCDSHFSLCW